MVSVYSGWIHSTVKRLVEKKIIKITCMCATVIKTGLPERAGEGTFLATLFHRFYLTESDSIAAGEA